MSILNTNKKKNQGKKGNQQKNAQPFPAPKPRANSKAATRNTRLTGGSQRGS